MSAPAPWGLGHRSRTSQTAQAGLRLVAPVRARAARTPFAMVIMVLLACGLSGLILISTFLQTQSFELSRLQEQSSDLTARHDALADTVAKQRNPSAIADQALELGMVPTASPVFLDLSEGSVIGKPTPAKSDSKIGDGQ